MPRLYALLVLAFAFLGPCTARAQVFSIYVQSANTHLSNVQTGITYSGISGSYTNQFTSYYSSGIGGGVTLNLIPVGPVRLGADLRGSTKQGTPGVDTAMAGLRLAFKPPVVNIKPYLQASGGYLDSRTMNVTTTLGGVGTVGGTFENRYAAYEVFAGVDIGLVPFIDLRLEAGGGQGFNTASAGANINNNVALFSINPGLVLHF